MAGDSTTLKVSIVGESGSAERAMQSVGRTSDGLASKLGRVAGGIGKALGGATLAAGGLAVAGGKMGIEVAAANEQARISFTTMLGSATKADDFLRKMTKFAAETPFDMPGLQTAASSLVSAGVDADKVIPIMRTLGDVTSGMGTGSEGIQRATVALQQMNAAQKISGEDLNQLRDAGIPVYDLLAKATGRSKKAIVELAQKGKLGKKDLDAMMKALESGKGLERFSGLMEKQSASLTGMWSTLKDTLGQGLATAIQPIIPLLKDGMGSATEFIAKSIPKVTAALKEMVGGVQAFGAAWEANDGDVTSSGFPGFMERCANLLREIQGGVVAFGAAWKANDGDITSSGFAGFMEKAAYNIRQMMDAIKSGNGFDKLREAFVKMQPTITNFLNELPKAEPVARKTGEVFGFIADHADLIAAALPTLLGLFAAFKAAQAANTVVGKDSVIGMVGQIASTLTLAASNRALAAAMNGTTGAQNAGIVATIRNRVVTAAAWVQTKAIAVANRAMAAAQWLVNAAMSANPLGLVVIALAALAAGLVYAYKNSETFRKICDAAFKGIAKIVQWLWESVYRPVFKLMLGAISGVADGFANFLDMLSHIPGFGWAKDAADKIRGAANQVKDFNKQLDSIDVYKEVNVVTKYTYPGYSAALSKQNNSKMDAKGIRGNAKGDTDISPGWSWVGEKGPELMWVPGGSTIYNAEKSKAFNARAQGSINAAHAKDRAAQDKARKAAEKAAADKRKKAAADAAKKAAAARVAAEKKARTAKWARLIGGKVNAKGAVINKYGDAVGTPTAQRLSELEAYIRKHGGRFDAYGRVLDKKGKVVSVPTARSQHKAAETAKNAPKKKATTKKAAPKKKAASSSSRSRSAASAGSSSSAGVGDVTVNVTVQGHVMTATQLAATLTPAIRNELVKIGKRNGNKVFPAPIKG